MADEKRSASETMQERIIEPLKGVGEALKGAGQKTAENSAALVTTVIDHAEANSREAFAALRAAARSTTIADALRVQGDYVREQGARGLNQAREIGEMIAKFGKDAASGFGVGGKEPGAGD